jgi:hypothetical protein
MCDKIIWLKQKSTTFFIDTRMNFGIEKCNIQSISRAAQYLTIYITENNEIISSADKGEVYKYLRYK